MQNVRATIHQMPSSTKLLDYHTSINVMITLYIVYIPLQGASIVFISTHAAIHSVLPRDSDEGEIEVTMEEVTVQ